MTTPPPGRHTPPVESPDTLRTTLGGFRFFVPGWLIARPLIRMASWASVVVVAGGVLEVLAASWLPWAVHLALGGVLAGALVVALVAAIRIAITDDVEVRLEGNLLTVGRDSLPVSGHLQCRLHGRELLVTSDVGTIAVPGPRPWLRWLSRQLLTLQPAGSIDEVPEALQAPTRRRAYQPRPSEPPR